MYPRALFMNDQLLWRSLFRLINAKFVAELTFSFVVNY